MNIDGYVFMVDVTAKFYNSIRVAGWFWHEQDRLTTVALANCPTLAVVTETAIPHPGVAALGTDLGFALQILQPREGFPDDARLEFTTEAGWTGSVRLLDLCDERAVNATGMMSTRFVASVNAAGGRLLDIGGRNRSTKDSSAIYTGVTREVLDILPGDNVTTVGDAHDMARLFPPDHFDAIFSVSVFEHLMMPWAVIPQMNRVLKTGGQALIATHQTLGMHDAPWDFWRFSDTAWDALFNAHTGFEIIERGMNTEQFILPFIYRPEKFNAERAAGFELSAVLVRKIGPCAMSWPLTPADINASMYPAGTEALRG